MRIYTNLNLVVIIKLEENVVQGGAEMFTCKGFWHAAGIRAIKTFAQTALSMITIGQAFIDVNWINVLSVSGVACLLSILTSLAGLPEVERDGA